MSQFWRSGSSRSRSWQVQCLVRACFLFYTYLTWSPHCRRGKAALWGLPNKGTNSKAKTTPLPLLWVALSPSMLSAWVSLLQQFSAWAQRLSSARDLNLQLCYEALLLKSTWRQPCSQGLGTLCPGGDGSTGTWPKFAAYALWRGTHHVLHKTRPHWGHTWDNERQCWCNRNRVHEVRWH